uniref:Uncharacterized protein n=1 Tax=Cacopsylla melanoneura TaxID=428564 RepID=A0A8D9AZ26_9HEMI
MHPEKDTVKIPSLEVLRKAKHEALSAGRLHQDPFLAVCMLQDSDPLREIIHEEGREFVHFWSAEQITIYNDQVRIGNKKICIDASGKFVHKIPRTDGTMSGHFFLNIPENPRGQIPVCQMLLQRHNTNAISYWCKVLQYHYPPLFYFPYPIIRRVFLTYSEVL